MPSRLLIVAVLFAALGPISSVRVHADDEGDSQPSGMVDVKFGDGSSIKLMLKQEQYVLNTIYGKLTIPAKDLRLIELAPRVADDVSKQIEEAAANLASPQFEIREKAAADLLKLGPSGYPVLLRLAKEKRNDLEVSARLDDVIEKVRTQLPDEQGEPREWDIVHTSSSRIAGHLEGKTVKAGTAQFGEVQLKLADVRDLRFQAVEEFDLSKVEAAPANLYDKANEIGKTFTYKIKGSAAGGSVWGTDTYTLDSSLAAAVVHAGVVKDGKMGIVRLKIVASPEAYTGTSRNGVTSYDYGSYPAAYKILKR